ncbi:hypothetical protein [Vreelandella sp. GE22]
MLIATDKQSSQRQPYRPTDEEWSASIAVVCEQCRYFLTPPGCQVIEGMIEMKDGGPWPEGGWVTDPGAGMTCLSYQPLPVRSLGDEELEAALNDSVPMCGGCAARKGSDASKALHTQRDFRQAVSDRGKFMCHEPGSEGKACGGWCDAVRRKRGDV